MTAIQYLVRFLFAVVRQPGVQASLTEAGRQVTREATKKLIREVQNGYSRYEQKRSPRTIS